jgi:Na+/phosphate symporter
MDKDAKEAARAELVGQILAALEKALDEAKRSLFSRDKKRLARARKALKSGVGSSLSLLEEAAAQKETVRTLRQLGTAAEDLMRQMGAALEGDISFTEDAASELSEVMALVKDAARDAGDALAAKSSRFREYVLSTVCRIVERMEEYSACHEGCLVAGMRPPAASFLYLDVMGSLKRIAIDLATVAQDA